MFNIYNISEVRNSEMFDSVLRGKQAPRTVFEARKVAGSATCKHSDTVCDGVVHLTEVQLFSCDLQYLHFLGVRQAYIEGGTHGSDLLIIFKSSDSGTREHNVLPDVSVTCSMLCDAAPPGDILSPTAGLFHVVL